MVSLSGTMHITVVQAGAAHNHGPIAIFDETSALDTVTGTVDDTGRVTARHQCAPIPMGRHLRHHHPSAMLTFSHGALSATSDDCGLVGTLTRQSSLECGGRWTTRIRHGRLPHPLVLPGGWPGPP